MQNEMFRDYRKRHLFDPNYTPIFYRIKHKSKGTKGNNTSLENMGISGIVYYHPENNMRFNTTVTGA